MQRVSAATDSTLETAADDVPDNQTLLSESNAQAAASTSALGNSQSSTSTFLKKKAQALQWHQRVKEDAARFLRRISLGSEIAQAAETPTKPHHIAENRSERVNVPPPQAPFVQVASLEAVPAGELGRSRLALALPDGLPFAVLSVLPYVDTRRKRLFARDTPADDARLALRSPKHTTPYGAELDAEPEKHDPDALDDRALHHGKHQRTLALTSYVMTVTLYVTPAELKQELNQQFKERHPHIQLTLTKLRSLKRDMIDIGCRELNFNISTVALAQMCFERLVLSELVTKLTRKIIPACCLLLAFKYNNTSRHSIIRERIKDILKVIEDYWRVSPREVLESEFSVYSMLKFQILADPLDLDPYLRRVQQAIEN